MEQIAIVARLKSGAEPRAAELIAQGPPFDPGGSGLERHTVYLSADEVLFVFEGDEVEWIVDSLVDEPFQWELLAALDEWRSLLEDNPRIARVVYSWRQELPTEAPRQRQAAHAGASRARRRAQPSG